jgi:hypothetical protein
MGENLNGTELVGALADRLRESVGTPERQPPREATLRAGIRFCVYESLAALGVDKPLSLLNL